MHNCRLPRRARASTTVALALAALSGGESAAAAAPSIPMFGSFFPAWLVCLFGGVILTVILRLGFIVIGLDDILRVRVAVYMSMAVGLTFLLTYLFFGR